MILGISELGIFVLDILIGLFYLLKEMLRFLPIEAYVLIILLVVLAVINKLTF